MSQCFGEYQAYRIWRICVLAFGICEALIKLDELEEGNVGVGVVLVVGDLLSEVVFEYRCYGRVISLYARQNSFAGNGGDCSANLALTRPIISFISSHLVAPA